MWNKLSAISSLLSSVSPFRHHPTSASTNIVDNDTVQHNASISTEEEVIDLYSLPESQHDIALVTAEHTSTVDTSQHSTHNVSVRNDTTKPYISTESLLTHSNHPQHNEQSHQIVDTAEPSVPILDGCIPIDCIDKQFEHSVHCIRVKIIRQYNVSNDTSDSSDMTDVDTVNTSQAELRYEIMDLMHPSYGIHTIELHCRHQYATQPNLFHINDYITINQCSVQSMPTSNDIMEHKYKLVLDNELGVCDNTVLRLQTQRQRLLNHNGTVITNADVTYRGEIPSHQPNNASVTANETNTYHNKVKQRGCGTKRKSSQVISNHGSMLYTPLGELRVNTQDNVYGIITRDSDPKPTQGSDWHIQLNITDHTWQQSTYYNTDLKGLTLNIFRADRSKLPQIQRKYDIIRLHRVDIKLYQSTKLQGISYKFRSSHILIDGRLDQPYEPYHSSSDHPTEVDQEIVDTLRQYIATHLTHNTNRHIRNTTITAANTVYAPTISDLSTAQFCDLHVKVLYIDTDCRILYVWDGTDSPLPLKYNTLSNREATPDGIRMIPEYGSIVPISYNVVSQYNIQHAVPGNWTLLKNVNVQISDTGALYINYFKYSECLPISLSTLTVIDRLNKYKQRIDAHKAIQTNAHNIVPSSNKVVHPEHTTSATTEPVVSSLKYLSELCRSDTCDLVVKVCSIDSYRRLVYIWDGTDVQCTLQYITLKNNDIINNTRLPAYGTILSLTHSDSHAYLLAHAQVNRWVLLSNIKVVFNENNKVFLKFDRHSKCSPLTLYSLYVSERLNQYQQRLNIASMPQTNTNKQTATDIALATINAIATNQPLNDITNILQHNTDVSTKHTTPSDILDRSITTHSNLSQQIVPIKSLICSKSQYTARKYRVHARVYGITPVETHLQVLLYCRSCHCSTACNSEGNDTCSECRYDTDIEYRYAFKLLLGDISGVITVIVTGDAAKNLLQIEPCNLYMNENIRNSIKRRIDYLCSLDNWLDCCLIGYTAYDDTAENDQLSQIDDEQAMKQAMISTDTKRTNYQLFDTMIKPYE